MNLQSKFYLLECIFYYLNHYYNNDLAYKSNRIHGPFGDFNIYYSYNKYYFSISFHIYVDKGLQFAAWQKIELCTISDFKTGYLGRFPIVCVAINNSSIISNIVCEFNLDSDMKLYLTNSTNTAVTVGDIRVSFTGIIS